MASKSEKRRLNETAEGGEVSDCSFEVITGNSKSADLTVLNEDGERAEIVCLTPVSITTQESGEGSEELGAQGPKDITTDHVWVEGKELGGQHPDHIQMGHKRFKRNVGEKSGELAGPNPKDIKIGNESGEWSGGPDENESTMRNERAEREELRCLSPKNITNEKERGQSKELRENEECIMDVLEKYGLREYFPAKISLCDVMTIGQAFEKDEDSTKSVPWLILQKLIMLDHRARDRKYASESETEQPCKDGAKDSMNVDLDDFSDLLEAGKVDVNPSDLLLTVFSCCDLSLRQILVQKLFMCRLALPFILPGMLDQEVCLSLWPLRSAAIEYRNKRNEAIENTIACQSMNVVSFVRLDRPKFSKSKLLNNIVSDQKHDTYFNIDCYKGKSEKTVANGLVEASFFLPSGKETDPFQDLTMFLNLRGDASSCNKQVHVLSKLSNVVVACVDNDDLDNLRIVKTMKAIHRNAEKVLLLISDKDPSSINMNQLKKKWSNYIQQVGKDNVQNTASIFSFDCNGEKNESKMKDDFREKIRLCLENAKGKLVQEVADEAEIHIDERHPDCQRGKQFAEDIKTVISGESLEAIKKEMLPLQGEYWHEWSRLSKAHNRGKGTNEMNSLQEKGRIKTEMTRLRREQMAIYDNPSELMKVFITNSIELSDGPSLMFFLQWLKIHLDQLSRETLPSIKKQYLKSIAGYQRAKETKNDSELEHLRNEAGNAAKRLRDSSLGVEHLFREIGQIYEAALESKMPLNHYTEEYMKKLPKIFAKLLLQGYPFELMDGDSSCVPLTWVKAVFENIEKIVPNQRVFTLSVLGIQSSGKSTLLNTMFGLEFPVSAGRCTRGVYMQLVKVAKESSLPFDYAVVIDSEGLRAPELGDYKHNHDNELATFVVGLGDITLINIKGENVAEIEDVLQIVVHAFLRMGTVNKAVQDLRTCLFIHQNVAAVNAKDKLMYGCNEMKTNLDNMTSGAASAEHMNHIDTFNQIIRFDPDHHIWFFSDLWKGDPPMAPTNPGYHEKALEVKSCIFNEIAKDCQLATRFPDLIVLIQDIWKGIIHDDFVFSFRNS